jgi:hypothetical protein
MRRIERANLVLAVALTSLCGQLWGARGMGAAGAGGALSCANFWALRRLGARAVAGVESGQAGRAVALASALFLKMTALFALVWVAVRVAHLEVLPFSLGLSGFVVSILLVGLSTGAAEAGA